MINWAIIIPDSMWIFCNLGFVYNCHMVDNSMNEVTRQQTSTGVTFQNNSIELLSAFLVGVSLIYTQIYITSLPSIAVALSVPHWLVQWAFTGNMLLFGLSQLFYGPLSDYYGRKSCLIFGLKLALVGNIVSCFSGNIIIFFIGQLLVGAGSGACSVIPRALSKDLLSDSRLIKAITLMSIASTVASGVSPILGGSLQKWFGWQSVFLCLVSITMITLFLTHFFIKETIKISNSSIVISQIIKNYGRLFLNKSFLGYILINSSAYSAIIIYVLLSPFLIQNLLHYSSSQNSAIYLFCAIGYIIGNISVNRYSEKFNNTQLLWFGTIAIILGCLFIIIPIHIATISLFELFLSGLLIHFGSGIVTPISYQQMLCIPEFSSGISSGTINATRVLLAFVFSLIATSFAT